MKLTVLYESSGSARFVADPYIKTAWQELSKLKHIETVPSGTKQQIGTVLGIKLMEVDGDWVKTHHDPDFVEGGNGMVYNFIPKDEVWVDSHVDDHENRYILFHELTERYLMIRYKMVYEQAHEIANDMEMNARLH